MSQKQIHLFISHAWRYSNHYETLREWIFDKDWSVGQASLDFRNNSISKENPVHSSGDAELKSAIYNKISGSHVIVIPMGMYANYRRWIQKEIDGSMHYEKPILAVDPWGQERSSSVVRNAATKSVGWNKKPLIGAIWDLYKQGYEDE